MKASTTVAGVTVSAYQPSGANQSVQIGASTDLGPISVAGEELTILLVLLSANVLLVIDCWWFISENNNRN